MRYEKKCVVNGSEFERCCEEGFVIKKCYKRCSKEECVINKSML